MIKQIMKIVIILMLIISSISVFSVNSETFSTVIKQNNVLDISEDDAEFRTSYAYKNSNIITGEVIVKFKGQMSFSLDENSIPNTGIETIDELNEKFQVTSSKKLLPEATDPNLANIYLLTCTEKIDPIIIAEQYNKNSNVEIAEPNTFYSYCTSPNDPRFDNQWGLHQSIDCDIDAPEAWEITKGSSDVVIAILDSGVDITHPDLIGKMYKGWNFMDDNGIVFDAEGHGTHCAGIAAANSNNGLGIAGVSWNSKIMPLKAGDWMGIYKDLSIEGIYYAADNGADIISMSWGSDDYSALLEDAVEYAYNKGVVLIAAAGNDNTDSKHYPSCFEHVISVGATNSKDQRWSEVVDGMWGPYTVGSNYGEFVDVSAPGKDILSTVPLASMDGLYEEHTGTSMACPHVAGVAALILANNPEMTPDMVKAQIQTGVDQINTDEPMGTGRINAYKALTVSPIYSFLDQMVNWADIKGTYLIKGSAYGEDFASYDLLYGIGEEPEEWYEISSSTDANFYGTLGSLNTNNLDEGVYTIKLTVNTNEKGQFNDTKKIVINNQKDTFYVDNDNIEGPWEGTEEHPYTHIQNGIDNAGIGDTVSVKAGTYSPVSLDYWGNPQCKGTFFIDREITLKGENRDTTMITHEGNQNSPLIKITADNVEISGISFKSKGSISDFNTRAIKILSNGNKIHDNIFSSIEANGAIDIEYSSNNIIENNIFTSTQENHRAITFGYWCNDNIVRKNTINNQINAGIGLWYFCKNNIIEQNTINGPYFGMIVYGECNENTIRKNTITNCIHGSYSSHSGILLTLYSCENNIIENEISNGENHGIFLEYFSDDNVFYKNKIKNNAGYGIRTAHYWHVLLLGEPAIYCKNNLFYQNVFAENQKGAARDDGSNKWHHNNIGNYYDDYEGVDRNNDKIGDSAYIIEGVRICYQMSLNPTEPDEEILRIPITHRDKYPLMDPEGKVRNRAFENSQNIIDNLINQYLHNFLRILQRFKINFIEV